MEIENKTMKTTFEDVDIGECFLSYDNFGDLFIRVESYYDKNCKRTFNAVRLKDGAFWPFENYVSIKKVKAKVEYEEV